VPVTRYISSTYPASFFLFIFRSFPLPCSLVLPSLPRSPCRCRAARTVVAGPEGARSTPQRRSGAKARISMETASREPPPNYGICARWSGPVVYRCVPFPVEDLLAGIALVHGVCATRAHVRRGPMLRRVRWVGLQDTADSTRSGDHRWTIARSAFRPIGRGGTRGILSEWCVYTVVSIDRCLRTQFFRRDTDDSIDGRAYARELRASTRVSAHDFVVDRSAIDRQRSVRVLVNVPRTKRPNAEPRLLQHCENASNGKLFSRYIHMRVLIGAYLCASRWSHRSFSRW